MKKLLLVLITAILLTGCECGCSIEDSTKPLSELSEAGKVLVGKHYLGIIPGTDKIVELDENGQLRMFPEFNERYLIHSFSTHKTIFEKTTDKPHVKFEWESNNSGHTIYEMLIWDVQKVILCTPSNFLNPTNKEQEVIEVIEDDYVRSLIEGTN